MKSTHYLLLITVLGAVLRLYGLSDESLWLDEGILLQRIEASYAEMLSDKDSRDQGPIFPALEKIWTGFFGESEFSLRFLPSVFGILAIPSIYFLALRLFGSTAAALFASFLLAINPFAIHYSQDARPYTLFLAASLISYYYLLHLLASKSRVDAMAYAVSSLFAMYSHPYGIFMLISQIAIAMIYQRKIAKSIAFSFALVTICYAPLLAIFGNSFWNKIQGIGNHAIPSGYWLLIPDFSDLKHLPINYFHNPYLAYLLVYGAILIFIWKFKELNNYRKPLGFIGIILFSLVGLPLLVSNMITPIWMPRFGIPALGAVILLLSLSVMLLNHKLRLIFVLLIVIFSLNPLYGYYNKIDKDPWRISAKLLNEHIQHGDLIVLNNPKQFRCFTYYNPQIALSQILAPEYPNELEHLAKEIVSAKRIWIVGKPFREWPMLQGKLYPLILENRRLIYNLQVSDYYERNPAAESVAEIRLMCFQQE